ncbi:MAG: fibronectin type III domain-containing protein [Patescibacteria group bacterium]|nr:fibronectin type III domain-containing protein [Patescibacteria group bacterium]
MPKITLKKIPVPLGLFIIILGLAGTITLVNRSTKLKIKAAEETQPQRVKITNVASNSFVVSWLTNEETTGEIFFGETKELGLIKKDLRDQKQDSQSKYKAHYVLIDNLEPEKKYYFEIVSDGKSFKNSEVAFTQSTAPNKTANDNDLAQGKILNTDQQPAPGVLVYLSLANTLTQAALTDLDGNWIIPLSTARTPDLQNFANYDRNAQIEEILVQGEKETATATLTTGNDNPTPNIVLGQSYNFIDELKPPTTSPAPLNVGLGSEGFNLPTQTAQETPLTITFPNEGEKISTLSPEFFGNGPENQKLDIILNTGTNIKGEVTVSSKGKWSWTATTPLTPGKKQITVSFTNNQKKTTKISRNFSILATGESDLPSFTATPSGQTATITIKPTLISPSPTIKPTEILKPTATSVPKVTQITALNTTTPAPSTGNYLPTNLFLGIGAIITLIGIVLVLF